MLRFCCWNYHQRAFQGCKAQLDFTSLCTSPEPKLDLQVKQAPRHGWRCLGCVSVPHPRCGAASGDKQRKVVLGRALLQSSTFGLAKNKNKGEFNKVLSFRLRAHTTALPFPGLLEAVRLFASSLQGSVVTLFFSPVAGKEV